MAEGLGPAEAESREFAVIREHYSLLVKTISSNITYFAVKFYEKKFISYSSKRDITSILGVGEEVIADKLLEKALNNLSIARSKEKWFHVFTAIFRAECAYQDLADTMEEFYADSCQSVVVSIRAEVAEFDERFRFVVYNTRCHLYRREKEQDDFLTQFKMMLKDLSLAKKHSSNAFLKEREEIESATSSDEIIDIIDPYWSFSNCGFLRCIIRIFGTRELKQEMKTYVTDIEDFQKKTKVKDWYMATMGEAKTAEHYERLCITVNEDWEERTLYDAYQFKKDLDIKAAITNEAASPVIDFDIGSLKIVMAFAPVVVPEVKVVIEDPQFRLSHNIVEAVWLPSSTSSLPQPSSQPSLDQRGSERVTLLIKYKEERLQLSLNLSSKVLELKSRLVQCWRWLKDSSYTLEFNDEVLENHEEIRKYGIDEKSIIILKIFPLDSSQAPPSGSQGTRSLHDTLYRQMTYHEDPEHTALEKTEQIQITYRTMKGYSSCDRPSPAVQLMSDIDTGLSEPQRISVVGSATVNSDINSDRLGNIPDRIEHKPSGSITQTLKTAVEEVSLLLAKYTTLASEHYIAQQGW
ncbi:hypothetical protein GBAR_LOCUS29684 [Geodia barretti]|uniref:Ubiquitin-like domain-containing protein n=1 Tax=Geodia barretti TaxID=519541 RepID=A0AA35TWK8_GEOBA|nr:hypothetical protein GBAR_LOCUS29684 [Geodia barretti]